MPNYLAGLTYGNNWSTAIFIASSTDLLPVVNVGMISPHFSRTELEPTNAGSTNLFQVSSYLLAVSADNLLISSAGVSLFPPFKNSW